MTARDSRGGWKAMGKARFRREPGEPRPRRSGGVGWVTMFLFAVVALGIPALWPGAARAGGGPAHVLVLYNGDHPPAATVAEYYREARSIPQGQLCALYGIDPTTRTLDFADYETLVHAPFGGCLDALPQPEEIDYVVIVRGLPYRVSLPDGGFNTSLSALLQIHDTVRVSDGEFLAGLPQQYTQYHQASVLNPFYVDGYPQSGDYTVQNPYSSWYVSATTMVRQPEQPWSFSRRDAGAAGDFDFTDNLFVVTRLDGFDADDATALVDRAVAADSSFPTAEILCMEGSDEPRAARDPECEFVTRYLAGAGFNAVYLEPFDGSLEGREVAAYFTGTANLRGAIAGNTYVPGAITCNLTSTGAAPTNFFCNTDGTSCPASESQTSIARFVRAGATGAHGAVSEPLNNTFPNAGALLLYTMGYNLGESYFFAQRYLYWQNIYLGDPLTTPYALRPEVTLSHQELPQNVALTVDATHPDGVAATRVYLDGALVEEATSLPLQVELSGYDVGDTVDVLAVAVAQNATVQRPGWPEETQLPRNDVQGWQAATLEILDPQTDPDAGVGTDGQTTTDGGSHFHDGGEAGDASTLQGGGSSSGCSCRHLTAQGSGPHARPRSADAPLFALLFLLTAIGYATLRKKHHPSPPRTK